MGRLKLECQERALALGKGDWHWAREMERAWSWYCFFLHLYAGGDGGI